MLKAATSHRSAAAFRAAAERLLRGFAREGSGRRFSGALGVRKCRGRARLQQLLKFGSRFLGERRQARRSEESCSAAVLVSEHLAHYRVREVALVLFPRAASRPAARQAA